jgi:hypothetical protein
MAHNLARVARSIVYLGRYDMHELLRQFVTEKPRGTPGAYREARERAERKLAKLAPNFSLDTLTAARERGKAGELANSVIDALSYWETWLADTGGQVSAFSSL